MILRICPPEPLTRKRGGYGRILGGKGPERENQKSENQKSIICQSTLIYLLLIPKI
jgi:hypothetical protein